MKIAVTYDKESGQVFQHFGTASVVKIYEVSGGKIVSSEVIDMIASGHSLIAGVLFGNEVSVVICGKIKPTAAQGLTISGIQLFAGASGDADEAVNSYISGSLKHDPAACSEDEACGHHDNDDIIH